MGIEVREATADDRGWMADFIAIHWPGDILVSLLVVHRVAELNGLVAWEGDQRAGLLTWVVKDLDFEVVTLSSASERRGIGTALMKAAIALARQHDCSRVWLVTSNDNTPAIRFYQRLGMRMVALHRDVVDHQRATLKPTLPLLGLDGIPLHDEIEFEIRLR